MGVENEVSDKAFYSNLDGGSVYFDKIQNLSIEHEIAINETFTVEIEKKSTRIQFCLCSLKFLQVSMTKFFRLSRE